MARVCHLDCLLVFSFPLLSYSRDEVFLFEQYWGAGPHKRELKG